MKKLFPVILLIAGLTATHATAQTRLPARQVSVSTNNWTELAPTATTAQAVFDYLNAEGLGLPGTNIVGATFSGNQWTVDTQTDNFVPGTNIVGATFSGNQWTVDTQTDNFVPGTNIVGATYDETNKTWTVDSQTSSFLTSSNTLFGDGSGFSNISVQLVSASTAIPTTVPSGGFSFITNYTSGTESFTNDYGIFKRDIGSFSATKPGSYYISSSRSGDAYFGSLIGAQGYTPVVRLYRGGETNSFRDYGENELIYVGTSSNVASFIDSSVSFIYYADQTVVTSSVIFSPQWFQTGLTLTQNVAQFDVIYLGD